MLNRQCARLGLAALLGGLASGAAFGLDVTPPVLTVVNASATLNLRAIQQSFNVLIKGTDDISGIRSVLYQAIGPSGQHIFGRVIAEYPSTNFSRKGAFAFHYSGRALEPGVWTIDEARVEDVAGNHRTYNQTQLAALGNTSFTVVNTAGYDAVAPTLTSGQVLTPTVSLSAFAKGTNNQAPFVGVKLTAADTGSSAAAGIAGAAAAFCIAGDNPCVELLTSPSGGSQATATLFLGAQVSAVLGHGPGEYDLCEVVLWDHAGNIGVLTSPACGGSTDFSTLFPTTKITLTP